MPVLAITRIAAGFLLAPLAGILVVTAFVCLGGPFAPGDGERCLEQMLPFLAWVGLFSAYPTLLLLGPALLLVLKRHGHLRPAPLALAGLAIGVAAVAVFFVLDALLRNEPVELTLRVVPFAMRAGVGFAGPIAGLAFWVIAVFGNGALVRDSIAGAPAHAQGEHRRPAAQPPA